MAALIDCPDCGGARMSRTSRQSCATCKGAGKVPEDHPAVEVARARAAAESADAAAAPAAPPPAETPKPKPQDPPPQPAPPVQPPPPPPPAQAEPVEDPLIAALVRAQTEAPELVASGRKDDRYDYATEGDYQATMRTILLREGLVLTTDEVIVGGPEEVPQKSGAPLPSRRTVRLRVRISHVSGRWLVVESAGTGTDTEGGMAAGDKAVSKALTAAWKGLWAHLFWYRRSGELTSEAALRARIGKILPAPMVDAWAVVGMGWPSIADIALQPDRVDAFVAEVEKRAPEIRALASKIRKAG